jgi:VCBS repeat-containing protein
VADLDWLRAGESLVLTYVAQVTDGAGNVGAQNLVITIRGTNDGPAITGATNPAVILEVAGDSSGQDIGPVTGTITVLDQDLGDTLTVSVTGNATALYNGVAVPVENSVNIAALVASGAISFAPATSNGESVTLDWTYDPAVADLDWLRAGESLVLTYVAQVTDGAGNVGAQNLVITIRGTNDGPVAVVDTNSGDAIVEGAGYGNSLTPGDSTAIGNVLSNDTDADLGETVQLRVTQIAFGSTPASTVSTGTTSADGTTIRGTYGTLTIGADGTWSYQLDDADLDTQALIDNGTEVFTYTIVDPKGATATATLTLTVQGNADGIFTTGADTLDLNVFVNMAAGSWDGANNPTLTGTLSALGGNDVITLAGTKPAAWAGLTTFSGGEGDDTIRVSAGYIDLEGDSGTDLVDFGNAADGVVATLDGTYEIGSTGEMSLNGFENLTGSAFDDVLTGNGGANVINGGKGEDTIDGGAGADTISGGEGDDDISGGAGDDSINAGAGNDTIRYQIGSDGQETVDGGANDDELVLTGTTGNQSIIVTVPQVANPTNFDINIGLPAGNDIFVTSIETLTIDAVSGTNDRLQVIGANTGTEPDTITATGTLADLTVDVNGGLTINGLNFDQLTLSGSGGHDRLDATDFESSITLNGNVGNDTLLGGIGNDTLLGGIGDDTISGAVGQDIIVGGEGNDILTGGNDQDRFIYAFGDGVDSVTGGEGNAPTDFDVVEAGGTVPGFGHATVDVKDVEAFDIDLDSDASVEISATEIEAIALQSGALAGSHILTILGRDIDIDPPAANMPGDERMIVENSDTGGILISLVENGEVILANDFEQLVVDGRQGDDEIDLQGLLATGNGLDAAIANATIMGGAGSDRFLVGEETRALMIVGGETSDSDFAGDTVQILQGGDTRIALRSNDSFEIDYTRDGAVDIDAREVERVKAEGTTAPDERLLVQGRNEDTDPFFPQDERITVTSDLIPGFALHFAENGETISGIDFEQLVIEGRDGDDVIDISGLAGADPTGLGAAIDAVRLLGGSGSDRFVTSAGSQAATIIGGETLDADFGGDAVELAGAGDVTVTYNDTEDFSIDNGSDDSIDIAASEIERIEARGTAAAGETLFIQGRNADIDPIFPQDERIIVESDPIAGFAVTLAENGEVITGIDFKELVIEGRDGDDVIDISGLAGADPTGLGAAIGAVRLLGGSGSDRFVTSAGSQAATIIGGETLDADFGGDAVELAGAGDVTVTYNDTEDFSIDNGSDGGIDIAASEIERIEARGTAAAGETLFIQGRNADIDPIFPQDERIIVESDPIAGFAVTLAENGEVITGIDFEGLVIQGRDGDDVIDVSLLTAGPDSGLDADTGFLVLDGGDGSDRFAFSIASHAATVIGGETGDADFGGDTITIEGAAHIVIDMIEDETFGIDFQNDAAVDIDASEIERIEVLAMGGDLTILGTGASGVLSGDEVITLVDEGLSGFVATYQNNGETVAGQDVAQLTIDGRGGDDVIDLSQVTSVSGIGKLVIDVAKGDDSVSLGAGGVRTEIRNFEVGNAAGGDTLDLEALFNAGFSAAAVHFSSGSDSTSLEDLLGKPPVIDFGSGFTITLDTAAGQVTIAEIGLTGSSPGSAFDIMNIAFDGQRTVQV